MAHRLTGVVLITGASSGIGRATADVFAKAGCRHLVLVDRDQTGLDKTVQDCNLDSSKVSLHVIDIKDDKAIKQLISEIPKIHGSLDYAINSAGLTGKLGTMDNSDLEEMDELLNTDLRAQIVLNKAEADAMVNSNSPSPTKATKSIVNLSSAAGINHLNVAPIYSIAKSGVITLTKLMGDAYGPKGVRVNAIAPGTVKTPMTDVLPQEALTYMTSINPLRRVAEAEEIGKLALFLSSEDASFITGTTVVIDGGSIAVQH